MSKYKQMTEFIERTTGQATILAIPRIFIDLTGDVKTALFLSQCVYWSDKSTRKDGWFWKKASEWEEQTGLSERELETARKKAKRFVTSARKQAFGKPTLHFFVHFDQIEAAIRELSAHGNSGRVEDQVPPVNDSDMSESSSEAPSSQDNKDSGIDTKARNGNPQNRELEGDKSANSLTEITQDISAVEAAAAALIKTFEHATGRKAADKSSKEKARHLAELGATPADLIKALDDYRKKNANGGRYAITLNLIFGWVREVVKSKPVAEEHLKEHIAPQSFGSYDE